MKTPKVFFIGVAITVLVGAGVWVFLSQRAAQSRAVAFLASHPSRPPYDSNAVRKNLEFWAAQTRSDPQGALARAKLAGCYLESYRETGDISDAHRAEKVARESLKIRSRNNVNALLQLSSSLLTQHRFAEALTFAQRAALYNSEGSRQCAAIELELGNYKAAARDFAKVQRDENDPSYLALAARFHELQGRKAAQLALLQKAAQLAQSNFDIVPQSLAWFHERLGHCLAGRGRLDEAEQSYQSALKAFPRDYRSMAALAHLEANRHNWPQAIEWAKKATAIVPAPETLALLGDAYAATGNKAEAKRQFTIIEDMSTLERSQGMVYDRQRALFNAEHKRNLVEAEVLARGELKLRRDIYAYDTLAWVLYKNGKFAEAQKAIEKALSQGTQDASLYFHAGMIAAARKDRERAVKHLAQALKINPQFHPRAPQEARALLAKLNADVANR